MTDNSWTHSQVAFMIFIQSQVSKLLFSVESQVKMLFGGSMLICLVNILDDVSKMAFERKGLVCHLLLLRPA